MKVLGKYTLGIGDGFIAMRIEQFIKEGKLKAVTKAKPGSHLITECCESVTRPDKFERVNPHKSI